MRLDLTSFGRPESTAITDSAFEILRVVLDLEKQEETAIRQILANSANELRDQERLHIRDFSVGRHRLSFDLSGSKGARESQQEFIAVRLDEILGEKRSAMFKAITGMDQFNKLPEGFAGRIVIEFEPSNKQFTLVVDSNNREITWATGPAKVPFERFDHLVDPAAALRFFGEP